MGARILLGSHVHILSTFPFVFWAFYLTTETDLSILSWLPICSARESTAVVLGRVHNVQKRTPGPTLLSYLVPNLSDNVFR